jgi:hypothetical protein
MQCASPVPICALARQGDDNRWGHGAAAKWESMIDGSRQANRGNTPTSLTCQLHDLCSESETSLTRVSYMIYVWNRRACVNF